LRRPTSVTSRCSKSCSRLTDGAEEPTHRFGLIQVQWAQLGVAETKSASTPRHLISSATRGATGRELPRRPARSRRRADRACSSGQRQARQGDPPRQSARPAVGRRAPRASRGADDRGPFLERLILDTTVLVTVERSADSLDAVISDEDDFAIAAITAAELLLGVELCEGKSRRRRRTFVEDVLSTIPIEPYVRASPRLPRSLDRGHRAHPQANDRLSRSVRVCGPAPPSPFVAPRSASGLRNGNVWAVQGSNLRPWD